MLVCCFSQAGGRAAGAGRSVPVQVGVLDSHEGVGDHAHGDGVMPRGPGPYLMLIEADEILALLVVLLDLPPGSGDPDQGGRRARIRGVGEK
jgi:hypothetical protein